MRVTFLGTGVSIPYQNRAQSSILVEVDGMNVLVDVGYGSMLRLEQAGLSPSDIDIVFITHHHVDHNGELLNLLKARWLMECSDDVIIVGPRGTVAFFKSLMESYAYLIGKVKAEIIEVVKGRYRVRELEFDVIPTVHAIRSVGYVISNLGVSGDTKAIRSFISAECEVLIHELSLPFGFVADYHTTPENLMENLRFCKADRIYLTHLYPFTHARLDEILEYLRRSSVEIEVAEDLKSFRM